MSIQRISAALAVATGVAVSGCATTGDVSGSLPAPTVATVDTGSKYCQSHMEGGRSDFAKARDKVVSGATSVDKECAVVTVSAKNNRQSPTYVSYVQFHTPNCNSKAENAVGSALGFFSAEKKAELAAAQAACSKDIASLKSQFFAHVASEKAAYVRDYKLDVVPANRRGGAAPSIDSLVNVSYEATFDINQFLGQRATPGASTNAAPAVPAEIRRNVPGVRDAERIIRNPAGAIQRLGR